MTFTNGNDTGDSCEAFPHHAFNGLERYVEQQIAAWITTPQRVAERVRVRVRVRTLNLSQFVLCLLLGMKIH